MVGNSSKLRNEREVLLPSEEVHLMLCFTLKRKVGEVSEQKILHLSMGRIFCPTINDSPLDMPRKGLCTWWYSS